MLNESCFVNGELTAQFSLPILSLGVLSYKIRKKLWTMLNQNCIAKHAMALCDSKEPDRMSI